MFMAGVGGMGGAGQDLISSCSSLSYSGDEDDFQCGDLLEKPKDGSHEATPAVAKDWASLRQMLIKLGHFVPSDKEKESLEVATN
jgi:hypothetical protein